ncbi:MAG: phage antirepressor protein, partial [Prevotellaceae bacterium]|nr:phage antirepressor protein [Prevotellaceae bacterium]
MAKKTEIKLFEERQVRSAWDDKEEQWYFSVVDVVEVLTDSCNPTDYLKKMRKREPELGIYIG